MKGFVERVKTGAKIFFRCAVKVGQDAYGNTYYESRNLFTGAPKKLKRWVLYKGIAEGSKIPALWHAWLHFYGKKPEKQEGGNALHAPNLTGAFRNKIVQPPAPSPHYIPWKPE